MWTRVRGGRNRPSGEVAATAALTAADAARDRLDWVGAQQQYAAYLSRRPAHAEIWVQLGHARKEAGDLPAARAAYLRARELAPSLADVHLQLGHALKLSGEPAAALASYRQAAALDPGSLEAEREVAALARRGGATPAPPAALPAPPPPPPVPAEALRLRQQADAARGRGDWAAAAGQYAGYLAQVPADAELWVQLGHARKESGVPDAAAEAYGRAAAAAPTLADPRLHLGHLRKLGGDRPGAIAAYAEALRIDPCCHDAFRELCALDARALALAAALAGLPTAAPRRPPAGAERPGQLAIFTIASNNYLAQAAVLLASAREHYPEARLFLCLADRTRRSDLDYPADCEVVLAADLGIPDFPSFAFRYDQLEFCTALKPFMLRLLLAQLGFQTALYFDPDIRIFRRSDHLLEALWARASLAVTPHLCQPAPARSEPTDRTILRAGVFNLGFLGASRRPETLALLDWWAAHLQFECLNRPERGLFVDQRFLDLLPGFSGTLHICRSPATNLAYWNLAERPLTRHGQDWWTGDAPVEFFHFSGFDPAEPRRLSRHTTLFAAGESPELLALCAEYVAALGENGLAAGRAQPYGFAAQRDGTPIPRMVRRFFADRHAGWPDDPFASFDPLPPGPAGAGRHLPPLLRWLWEEEPALRRIFDPETGAGAAGLARFAAAEVRQDPAGGEALARRIEQAFAPSPVPGLLPRRAAE